MSGVGEFELIARYFERAGHPLPTQVVLGIGDDCALLQPTPGMQLAISSDMLVSGRHFFADVDPATLGHKALAVNLSDLAACGATPLGFTLALSLPSANPAWLQAFSQGLFALADRHHCPLVGGDTTQGPLNLCITVFGETPPGQALLRSGARAGDDLWVSGTLGDAALALDALLSHTALPPATLATARQRLEQPTPRVALGQALRGIASAAADVSDGLLGDLGHILKRSGVGAELDASTAMHLIAACAHSASASGHFDPQSNLDATVLRHVLSGGDDYELVFTAPAGQRDQVVQAGHATATPVTRIGRITTGAGVRVLAADGTPLQGAWTSFDHFKA
ncbi:thiamine-phosphate kinase [Rhodoferax bucti]|uniref:thiamine-phosphate kinase n=1 Tax=Rhodoferax bucti TaxID=2576305 RepID=UPI001109A5D0|nr:thiamine-phosphate kinase [Rhodoferax bucti]